MTNFDETITPELMRQAQAEPSSNAPEETDVTDSTFESEITADLVRQAHAERGLSDRVEDYMTADQYAAFQKAQAYMAGRAAEERQQLDIAQARASAREAHAVTERAHAIARGEHRAGGSAKPQRTATGVRGPSGGDSLIAQAWAGVQDDRAERLERDAERHRVTAANLRGES